MHLAVYLPLVMPLLAGILARPLAERLPPDLGTWLLTGTAVVLAAASGIALGLLAFTVVLRMPLVATAGRLSAPVFNSDDPPSVPVALIAGVLLAAAATAACRALWLRAVALIDAGKRARNLPGRDQVVITDDEAADAYTVPGWPCRIVITTGMIAALGDAERRVLLAHERAHVAGLHHLFTTAARLAAAANPLLRPVAAAVGYTVERWADERAAAVTGDRPLAARALAHAALARTVPAELDTGVVAFAADAGPSWRGLRRSGWWPALARHQRVGPVPRRMAALLDPPPRRRLILPATTLLIVAVAAVAALHAAGDLHIMVEQAQNARAFARLG